MGSDYRNSVVCRTDLGSCCSGGQGHHRGDWYFPNGTRLQLNIDDPIHEARGAKRVVIRRTSGTGLTAGIFCCNIPVYNDTDISVRDSVYVGLYPPSYGGIMAVYMYLLRHRCEYTVP